MWVRGAARPFGCTKTVGSGPAQGGGAPNKSATSSHRSRMPGEIYMVLRPYKALFRPLLWHRAPKASVLCVMGRSRSGGITVQEDKKVIGGVYTHDGRLVAVNGEKATDFPQEEFDEIRTWITKAWVKHIVIPVLRRSGIEIKLPKDW